MHTYSQQLYRKKRGMSTGDIVTGSFCTQLHSLRERAKMVNDRGICRDRPGPAASSDWKDRVSALTLDGAGGIYLGGVASSGGLRMR